MGKKAAFCDRGNSRRWPLEKLPEQKLNAGVLRYAQNDNCFPTIESYSKNSESYSWRSELFDGEFGVVAVAGDDGVLLGFAFFVLHAQWMAFVVDQKDFDLAVGAVVFGVGGTVGQDVLVADGVVDLAEDVGQRTLEERGEVKAACHVGEGLELILSLEVVHLANARRPYRRGLRPLH